MPAPTPLLSWPRSPVAVKDALSEDCPVMPRLDVEQMLLLASTKVGVMEERMRKDMFKIQMMRKHGLVHWGGVEEGRSSDWQNLIKGSGETMVVGGGNGRSVDVDELDDTVDDASGSSTASGSCPMCQVVMVMDMLRTHAEDCQGTPEDVAVTTYSRKMELLAKITISVQASSQRGGESQDQPPHSREDEVVHRPRVSLSMQDMTKIPSIDDLLKDEATGSHKRTDDMNKVGVEEETVGSIGIDSASPATAMMDRFEGSLWDRCAVARSVVFEKVDVGICPMCQVEMIMGRLEYHSINCQGEQVTGEMD